MVSINNLAVWGNPISHSLSPKIHKMFAEQFGLSINYTSIEGNLDSDKFVAQFQDFFDVQKAVGCNITSPFKTLVYDLLEYKSKRCLLSQACNTIVVKENNHLYGYNTDGYGLVTDLSNLGWIKEGSKVLILGAGGAVRGVLYDLLKNGLDISLFNRTYSKAEELVTIFSPYGNIKVVGNSLVEEYDLVINAIAFREGDYFTYDLGIISENTKFYDMQYNLNNDTVFLSHIQQVCQNDYKNGIGMLINQAAKSFSFWFNVLPNTKQVEDLLNNNL